MAVGRIKIILIALLILGLCLLFFKKNKEGFTSAGDFPSTLSLPPGATSGLIGDFSSRSGRGFKVDINKDGFFVIDRYDDYMNDKSTIINNLITIFRSATTTITFVIKRTTNLGITEYIYGLVTNMENLRDAGLTTSGEYYVIFLNLIDPSNEINNLNGGEDLGVLRVSYYYTMPTDCILSEWTNSGICTPNGTDCEPTENSESGRQTQTRYVIPTQFSGTCSDENSVTTRTINCRLPACPRDCVPGAWTNSGTCTPVPGGPTCENSATSFSGRQNRIRTINPAINGGLCPDPRTNETINCALPRCPINCVPGEWTSSSPCVAPTTGPTCESNPTSRSGTRPETRTVAPALYGGSCSTENSATTRAGPCALARCPIPCAPGAWTNSGTCVPKSPTRTCESPTTSLSGLQTQTRTVAPAQFNGACSAADSATTRTIDCSLPGCPTNCEPGAWTNSGSCAPTPTGPSCENSATSLSGKQLQTRTMIRETNGGSCPDSNVSKTIDCALSRCPINCVPGAWTNSGICTPVGSNCEPSETSKSGRQTQNRIITPAQFNGSCTDSNTSQTIECALDSRCPIPCEVSAWSNIGSCQQPASNILCEPTDTSQSGIQQKYHTLINPARFGGSCPITSPNTSNVQNFPCRLTTIPTCLNPFGDSSIVSLQTINNKDLPMFGTFPYNDIRITHDNIGDTAASIVDRQENFKNFTSELCV